MKRIALHKDLLVRCQNINWTELTELQVAVFEENLKGKSFVVHAPLRGGGKVGAVALVLLDAFFKSLDDRNPVNPYNKERKIFACILAEEKNLETIYMQLRRLGGDDLICHVVPDRDTMLKVEGDIKKKHVDILVTTPTILERLQSKVIVEDLECQFMVFMKLDKFPHDEKTVVNKYNAWMPSVGTIVFFSEVVEENMVIPLGKHCETVKQARMRNLKIKEYECSVEMLKLPVMLKLVDYLLKKHESIIVFTPKNNVGEVYNLLLKEGIECSAIDGFKREESLEVVERHISEEKRARDKRVLVCSNDGECHVLPMRDVIVLWKVPRSIEGYRARCSYLRQGGTVISLEGSLSEVTEGREVEKFNFPKTSGKTKRNKASTSEKILEEESEYSDLDIFLEVLPWKEAQEYIWSADTDVETDDFL